MYTSVTCTETMSAQVLSYIVIVQAIGAHNFGPGDVTT